VGPEDNPPRGSGPSGEGAGPPPPRPRPPSEGIGSPGDDARRNPPPRPPGQAGGPPSQPPAAGRMRFQDPATARPRPPTVGETRAREKAERERKEAERAQFEANVKRYHRNQRLKGGAAVVGVVGVVAALGYWALSPRSTTAQCVQEDANGGPIIVPDNYCTGHGGSTTHGGSGGLFIYSGHQYRYYYGSSGGIGSRPSGGTTIAPKGTTVKTSSGTTIQRGGLGSKFSGGGG
jgi:hypothetical protein